MNRTLFTLVVMVCIFGLFLLPRKRTNREKQADSTADLLKKYDQNRFRRKAAKRK